tara:strand:+ start:433 stop:1311 length:879 start_codon:yes stop_codon:yes gene_type:complete
MKISSLSLAGQSTFLTQPLPANPPQLTSADYHNVSGTSSGDKTSITDTNLTIPALPSGGSGKRHFVVFVTYRHLSSKLNSFSNQNSFYGMGGSPIAPVSGGNVSCTVNGNSTTFLHAAGSAFNGTAVFKGQADLSAGTATIIYSFPSSGGGNYAVALYVLDYINDIQIETGFKRSVSPGSTGTGSGDFGTHVITASDISQSGTTHNFRAAAVTSSNSSSVFINQNPFGPNAPVNPEPFYTSGLSNQDNGTNERNASHHLFHEETTNRNMENAPGGANASNGYSLVMLLAKIK